MGLDNRGRWDWPIIERRLVDDVVAAFRLVTGIALTGDMGVGKTLLAAQIDAAARRQGRTVERVWATVPTRSVQLGALARLLPDDLPAGALPAMQMTLVGIRRALDGDGLLIVDDAHLLDDLSIAVIAQLLADGSPDVLLTVRSGEPIAQPLGDLLRSGLVDEVEVGPLHRDEYDLLVAELGLGTGQEELWERSAGNPLVLRELVIGSPDGGRVTGRLRELVVARFDELVEADRLAADLLALVEPLPAEILTSATGSDLATLRERALVTEHDDGVVLGHPIHGEVLTTMLSEQRRGRLVELLADCSLDELDAVRVATAADQAGVELDGETSLDAARVALSRSQFALARRWGRHAVACGLGIDAELVTMEAEVATDPGRADAIDLDAFDHLLGDEVAWARAVSRWGAWSVWRPAAPERMSAIEAAIGRVTAPEAKALLLATLSLSFFATGEVRYGEIRRSLDELPLTPPDELLAPVVAMGAIEAVSTGRIAEAHELVEGNEPRAAGLPARPQMLGWQIGLAEHWALRLELRHADAVADLVERAGRARARGYVEEAVVLDLHRLDVEVERGRGAAVIDDMLAAGERLEALSLAIPPALGTTPAAAAGAQIGRLDGVEEALRAQERADPELVASAAFLGIGWAWMRARQGDPESGLARLDRSRAAYRRRRLHHWEAMLAHQHTRLGHGVEVAGRLRALADAAPEATAFGVWAEHAGAQADDGGPRLRACAVTYLRHGLVMYAAEAAAQASRAEERAGAWVRALNARLLAEACIEQLDMEPTPTMEDRAAVLADGELETVRLVLAGRADRAIAEELTVSRRTVENRLHRAYRRLGVSGRRELAEVLALGI